MNFPHVMETDRLVLKPIHEELSPQELYRYCGSSNDTIDEVTREIIWDTHEDILKSIQVLNSMRQDWESGSAPHYYIEVKETDEFAGITTLDINFENKQGELGIWLRKKYWGKKISKERAFALAEFGFTMLELSSIKVTTSESNHKSQSAIEGYVSELGGEKCGCIPDGHISEDGSVKDLVVYAVRSSEFMDNFTESDSVIQRIEW